MGRTLAASLTDREAEIMEQLWRLGTATSEQIRAELPDKAHDSTIRTLLRILEEKGFVSHRRVGRSFVFQPLVPRKKVQGTTLGQVIHRFFSGSPHDLVLRLLEDEQLTSADLESLLQQTTGNPSKSKSPPKQDRRKRLR